MMAPTLRPCDSPYVVTRKWEPKVDMVGGGRWAVGGGMVGQHCLTRGKKWCGLAFSRLEGDEVVYMPVYGLSGYVGYRTAMFLEAKPMTDSEVSTDELFGGVCRVGMQVV